VLPNKLEKHCTGAEPILDKNGLASKKAASAHLLLWICRRFSTDDTVLQAFGLLNLSVCIRLAMDRPGSACLASFRQLGWQDAVVISATGAGWSTFFLKTKKRSSSVGLSVCVWRSLFVLLSCCCPLEVFEVQEAGFPREVASLF
jgi:hypothetical protein